MIHLYHLGLCLFLIIFQTVLLDGRSIHFYDLLAPFVVYLGAYRRLWEAAIPLVVGGLAMDGLSGGVMGVHLTAYLWMVVGVRWAIQYLHLGNAVLMPLIVTAGVAFESLLVAFSAVAFSPAAWPVEAIFPVVAEQVAWGAVTGPFLVLLFMRGQKSMERNGKAATQKEMA